MNECMQQMIPPHSQERKTPRQHQSHSYFMSATRDALELDGTASSASMAIAALDLKVARRMWYGGFFGLPWLWFVVWFHFRKVAKLPHSDPQLQTYVDRSLIGAICGAVLFAAWVITVQLSWRSWGQFGQSLMLVTPEEAGEL
jgi:hypothetical protein